MTTLVLLPGLACDAGMWQDQAAALQEFAPRVSDSHTRHDSIEAMAADVLAAHAGALVLCGASMGGMVAMEAARQAPARVHGLALLGTNAQPESSAMRTVRENAIALFAQGRMAEVIEPNIALAFHPLRAADPALAAAYLAFVYRAGPQQLIRQNRAVIARPDARRHLPLLRCPVLVLCGDADLLAPPACSREIANLVPGARLELLAQCGHMLTMEQPAAVNALLRDWLASLEVQDGWTGKP